MKKNKYIKEIASRLPQIVEMTVSGYYEDYNEEGELVKFPNIVRHPINHERRIRNAYMRLGMDGVLEYLTWIQKLQTQRNDSVQNRTSPGQKEIQVEDSHSSDKV